MTGMDGVLYPVTLEVAPEFDKQPMAGETVIRTRTGATLTHRVLHPKGTRDNRMSDEDINDKFRDMARVHMDDAQISRLLDALWNAHRLDDLSALAPLLTFR